MQLKRLRKSYPELPLWTLLNGGPLPPGTQQATNSSKAAAPSASASAANVVLEMPRGPYAALLQALLQFYAPPARPSDAAAPAPASAPAAPAPAAAGAPTASASAAATAAAVAGSPATQQLVNALMALHPPPLGPGLRRWQLGGPELLEAAKPFDATAAPAEARLKILSWSATFHNLYNRWVFGCTAGSACRSRLLSAHRSVPR